MPIQYHISRSSRLQLCVACRAMAENYSARVNRSFSHMELLHWVTAFGCSTIGVTVEEICTEAVTLLLVASVR